MIIEGFVHRGCFGELRIERRWLTTLPSEVEWPRNKYVMVPYCIKCRTIVNVDELIPPCDHLWEEYDAGVERCATCKQFRNITYRR